MSKIYKNVRSVWFIGGLLLGVLMLLIVRFFTYHPDTIHYHANFAVYINGRREEFNRPQYYQEEAACILTNQISIPQQRAHMHDNINSVIHIHDHAVTWGQFFDNLGWYIGPNFMMNADGTLYSESDNSKLHLVLNNQDYTDLTPITNMVIKDRSRLLVSFGNIDSATLIQEFQSVPNTAAYYDTHQDPSSCSGNETVSWSTRLHHLF